MSSNRGGIGGIAIVALFAVVGVVALLALSTAASATSGVPAAPQGTSGAMTSMFGGEVSDHYRLHVGGEIRGVPMEPYRVVPSGASSPPGPSPTDFPFAVNAPIWTDPGAQTAPSMAVDSTGRIYVAFDHAISATNHDIYVAWSDDGGLTWTAPVPAADQVANEGNASIMIATGDRVVIFFDSNTNNPSSSAFFYSWSADRGNTWTVQGINFGGTAPFRDLRLPSFMSSGPGAYGAYQMWCTDAASCGGGSSSMIIMRDQDITDPSTWNAIYFAQPTDVELLHPAAGYLAPDTVVMVVEIESVDNTAWDLTWGRLAFPNTFTQDMFMCGTNCASTVPIWPSIALSGTRGILGGHFYDPTNIGPNTVIWSAYTANVASGRWTPTRDAGGGQLRIDAATVEQKHVHFSLGGTTAFAGYWKAGATSYVASTNVGANFGQPARVSDNTPATAIDSFHVVATANSTTAGPLVAWHDSRDGNPNIYMSGLQKFTVTIATAPAVNLQVRFDGGTWNPAPYSQDLVAGTRHTIEAQSPQPGGAGIRYMFIAWNDSTTTNPKTITAVADVTYTASFMMQYDTTIATVPVGRDIQVGGVTHQGPWQFWCNATSQVTLNAPSPQPVSATNRYRYSSWSDGGAQSHTMTCDAPKTVTANFVQQFLITVRTTPVPLNVSVDGTTYTSGITFWWDEGATNHQLVAPTPQAGAVADTQYVFTDWTGGPTNPVWNPTITASTDFIANYKLQNRVFLDSNPTGLSLMVEGVPATTRASFWWDAFTSHNVVASSPQSGAVGVRYVFSQWSDGDPLPSKTVVADAPKTVTAIFTTQYFLTMTFNVGTVSPGNGWYNANDVVPITATAPPGSTTDRYTFGGWTGDYTGTTPSGSVTMDAPKTVRANWIHEFRIEVQSNPSSQTITVDGGGTVTTPAVLWWAETTSHTLAAPPTITVGADTRWNFATWSGGVTTPTLTVPSVSGPATYTATYSRQFRVTLTTAPAGRTVLVDSVAYTAPVWFDENSQHTFDAGSTPQAGGTGTRYVFKNWDGGSTQALRTITVTAPMALTATYDAQYQLTITSTADGVPAGNPVCQGATDTNGCWYLSGLQATVVVTTPFQASNGNKYVLTGWSGDATGAAATATITMDGAKTAIASWRIVSFLEEFGVWLGLIIAIIVVVLIVLLLLMRRRKKAAEAAAPAVAGEEAAMPPPPPPRTQKAGGTKACPACGMEIPSGAKTCPVCGAPA